MITVTIITLTIISIVISFILAILLYPFIEEDGVSAVRRHCMVELFLKPLNTMGLWQYNIVGENNIEENEQYVVVCNHTSIIDSVFMALLPLNSRFLVASVFYNSPVVGWTSKLAGDINVDKTNSKTKKECIKNAIDVVKSGRSLIVYPEGRRSLVAPKLDKFYQGPFSIAKSTGVKILPVTLVGTHDALFKDAYITMYIDEPFYVDDIEESIEMTKRIMESNL